MAYQVDKFNGQFLVSVGDGTIDTTTDLRFVGKNYAGYGEVQNENFLHLLESFANTTPPPRVITGQIWYDSGLKKLRYYDGNRFKVAGGAEIGPTAPSGLAVGEFWWDTSAKQLYAWSGTDFELIGPEASPDLGQSTISAQVVKDNLNPPNNFTIIKAIVGGKTTAIFSESEFTLSIQDSIDGFSLVKKGVTLSNTSVSGISSDNYVFWGTASNATSLGGVPASQYIQSGNVIFNQEVEYKDPGFTVGDQNDFRLRVENGDQVVLENRLGNDISVRIGNSTVLVFRETSVVSGVAGSSFGTETVPWNNIFANNLIGNLTGNVVGNSVGTHRGNVEANDTTILIDAVSKIIGFNNAELRGTLVGDVEGNLTGTASNANRLGGNEASITIPAISNKTSVVVRDSSGDVFAEKFIGTASRADQLLVDANYRSASTGKTANTIAARTATGDLAANIFDGTATAARYADLAEKYLADQNYEVGTVVVVGGEAEVTASSQGQRAIGVVSANPAFMMNSELEGGTYIALKGRVPVKVTGSINKGDELVAHADGTAIKDLNSSNKVFAIALESCDFEGINTIEAVIL
jgi:hypothetical protein